MLYILGYLLCVYLVFKGIEIYQLSHVSSDNQKYYAKIIGIASLSLTIAIAAIFVFWINQQESAFNITNNSASSSTRQETQEINSSAPNHKNGEINWTNGKEYLTKKNVPEEGPVLVWVSADWSIQSQEWKLNFKNDQIKTLMRKMKLVKIDMTEQPQSDIKSWLSQHKVNEIPSILFFNREGEEVKKLRVTGSINKHKFRSKLKKIID